MTESKEITIQKEMVDATVYDPSLLSKLQKFVAVVNKEPDQKMIQDYPMAKGVKYLPISHLEMLLDECFFGQWQTKNFTTQVIVNEIIGSIEVWVKHPMTNEWLCRIGVAGVQIRQTAGSPIAQIDTKIKNALVMDMPHLKSQCIKNGIASFGKLFGRDINRKVEDNFNPIMPEVESPLTAKRKLNDDEFKKFLAQSDDYIQKFVSRVELTENQQKELDVRLSNHA